MAPRQTDPQFKLRLPPDLKARIEASAQFNGRSVSGEILQVLEQYFPPEPTVDELVDSIEMYVNMAANPDAPPYRRGLYEKLTELRDRLKAGIDFEHPMNLEVMSPEEVEDARIYKERRNERRDLDKASENTGVPTDQFRKFMQGVGMDWVGSERLRRAIEELEDKGVGASLTMLGLKYLEFQNKAEAHQVYREELARRWEEAKAREEYDED